MVFSENSLATGIIVKYMIENRGDTREYSSATPVTDTSISVVKNSGHIYPPHGIF